MNVFLALTHERHQHAGVAGRWISGVPVTGRVVFCRMTQLGLLRLLTTRSAMGDEVLTQAEAWSAYDLFAGDGRFGYLDEPRELEHELRIRTARAEASPKQWADAYLAAFSKVAGVRVVTFDRALAGMCDDAVLLRPDEGV